MDGFATIDVETANPDPGSICQIGVVRFASDGTGSRWKSLISPDRFLAATDQISAWTIERSAPLPFPDFVLPSQGGVVGVEVTQVYREHSSEGPPRQETEGLRDRITSAKEYMGQQRWVPR